MKIYEIKRTIYTLKCRSIFFIKKYLVYRIPFGSLSVKISARLKIDLCNNFILGISNSKKRKK